MLTFLNSALLFGGLLFAVPLIIHLLNRHRYKRRSWAAMEFLLRAFKKQRRRLRRENLLLLLLRCLIPVILALAIARPQLHDSQGFGPMSGAGHHVIVFDHSYSMGLSLTGSTTPFERAKTLASALVDRIADRTNQKVSLVRSGVRPSIPVKESINFERVKATIASLPPPEDTGQPLTEALLEVAKLVEEAKEPELRVHLFTDLQVRAFGEDPFKRAAEADAPPPPGDGTQQPTAEMFADTAADAIKRIKEKADLTVFDVRGRDGRGGREDNIQVSDVRLGMQQAIARVPVPVVATVVNRTEQSQALLVTLEIDGGQPIRKPLQLEAGAEGEVEFETTLREVGQRRLRVHTEGDGLEADNHRFVVVTVREKLRLLLVEGSGEDDAALRETTHFLEVLDPTDGDGPPELTTFAPRVIDNVSFLAGREKLTDYDLIVLANLSHIDDTSSQALRAAVQSGVGLLVLFGDETDVENYNILLHAGGDGPMPMRLIRDAGFTPGGDDYYGIRIQTPRHPLFADIDSEIYRQIFENLPVYRFFRTEPIGAEPAEETDEEPTVQVLASIRDDELSPLLIASRFGAGKVLFCTSPINRRPDPWNELHSAVGGISFMLLHPMTYWLTLPSIDPRNVEVGSSLTTTLGDKPTDLAIVPPERSGDNKVLIADASVKPLIGDRYALPPFRETYYAGFYEYEMSFESGASRTGSEFFAVNANVDEGDLAYYAHATAKEQLGIDEIRFELQSSAAASLQSGFSDLGLPLLFILLLFVVGEAALARWVARRRS